MMTQDHKAGKNIGKNRRVAFFCTLFFITMLGVSFAAVPLYDLFCRVTGFGGTPMIATSAPDKQGSRKIKVRFDANVAPDLPWEFKPEIREKEVVLGETVLVNYTVKNLSGAKTWATASYNVTPELSGAYFAKLQCFCFTSQSLDAGETMNMPVVFFIDPALDEDKNLDRVSSIALSYTFFATKEPLDMAKKNADSTKPVQPPL